MANNKSRSHAFRKKTSFWRKLRLSLKYRPEIYKLILKMRRMVNQKKKAVNELKKLLYLVLQKIEVGNNTKSESYRNPKDLNEIYNTISQLGNGKDYLIWKTKDSASQTSENNLLNNILSTDSDKLNKENECVVNEITKPNCQTEVVSNVKELENQKNSPNKELTDGTVTQNDNLEIGVLKSTKDLSCQTEESYFHTKSSKPESLILPILEEKKTDAWNTNSNNNGEEKSIADQVKEVAQNALRESGMVYVESAGMYYDYKTGYYYNSELGLYYHTDTGCYYYYSDEKKTFVFHSYPDTSATSQNVPANRKRTKKTKKVLQTEKDLDNLTKNFSQDAEDEGSKAKRRKKTSRKILSKVSGNKVKPHKDITNEKVSSNEVNTDKDMTNDQISKDKPSNNTQNVDESTSDNQSESEQKVSYKIIDSVQKESNSANCEAGTKEDVEENKTKADPTELEDGECSDTESESEHSESDEEFDCSTESASDDDSVAKHHPPSMRVIVHKTNLPKLKVGSLFLVTKDGGTLGREGEQHVILIKDSNVSRIHLDIRYDMERQIYTLKDLGSKNGTVLNGKRMSESQEISEPMEVVHGSTIQLGETKLLCHIHPGNDTCGHCEPGLIMETEDIEKKVAYTRTCSVKKQHQLELARLKNLYAPQLLSIEDGSYNDRAKARRDTVGSSHDSEKTQSTDLETSIQPENKGFKLLEKMGWSKGEGLGKDSQGDTEPIPLVANEGKLGLGTQGAASTPGPKPFMRPSSKIGSATLRLATKTKMLQPPAKAFQNPLEEDDEGNEE